MPINDYTDCVDRRAKYMQRLTKEQIINIINEEMKQEYGDFKIGAMMGLINLRTKIIELET